VFWGLLSQLLIASTYFAVLFVMSLHLQRQLRWTPTAASFELLPSVAAFGVGGWVMARLPERARRFGAPFSAALYGLSLLLVAAHGFVSHGLSSRQS